jgi:hypothetical protein
MALATRTTVWVRGENGIERRVRWFAGYDCRVECVHEVKGQHTTSYSSSSRDQHGDEIWLEVRSSDAALTLQLFTNVRDRQMMMRSSRGRLVNPAYVTLHFGFPFEESQVRTAATPQECDVLGSCFSDEESPCRADTLWPAEADAEIESALTSPNVEEIFLKCAEPVWKRLETALMNEREVRWKKHVALPRQCDKCHGTGVVVRLS